jgi:hypothetical protein
MRDVLSDAYGALRRVTPLGALDCGALCGGRCCKGSDGEGMELFHGEEALFRDDPDFTVRETDGRKLLVCSGRCRRQHRPLSCRMYPFFPMPYEEDGVTKIRVVYDLRGYASCPIVRHGIAADPRFVRAVRMAGLYLLRDAENERILKETAALFEDLVSFSQTIRK